MKEIDFPKKIYEIFPHKLGMPWGVLNSVQSQKLGKSIFGGDMAASQNATIRLSLLYMS